MLSKLHSWQVSEVKAGVRTEGVLRYVIRYVRVISDGSEFLICFKKEQEYLNNLRHYLYTVYHFLPRTR